jgi:hypothetical protein
MLYKYFMKRNKEKFILTAIILIAIVIAGLIYTQNNKIQTTPYQPSPSPVQTAGSSGASGGTAASVTNPSVSPATGSNSNNSGTSAQVQPTTMPTGGVNSTQPSTLQPTGSNPLVSTQPTPMN